MSSMAYVIHKSCLFHIWAHINEQETSAPNTSVGILIEYVSKQ